MREVMVNEALLKKFFLAVEELRLAMDGDISLDETEQLRLENRIAFLQMTYMEWKCRNVSSSFSKSAPVKKLATT